MNSERKERHRKVEKKKRKIMGKMKNGNEQQGKESTKTESSKMKTAIKKIEGK